VESPRTTQAERHGEYGWGRSEDRILDADIWRAAVLMVKRYGHDPMIEAAERADQRLDEATWPAPRRGTGY
jgi:hypothetical protein